MIVGENLTINRSARQYDKNWENIQWNLLTKTEINLIELRRTKKEKQFIRQVPNIPIQSSVNLEICDSIISSEYSFESGNDWYQTLMSNIPYSLNRHIHIDFLLIADPSIKIWWIFIEQENTKLISSGEWENYIQNRSEQVHSSYAFVMFGMSVTDCWRRESYSFKQNK